VLVTVTGSGWSTEDTVRVTFGAQINRKDADVNTFGSFSALLVLPVGLQHGVYDVRVDGLQSGRWTTSTFNVY
jgi:hypothetical protein